MKVPLSISILVIFLVKVKRLPKKRLKRANVIKKSIKAMVIQKLICYSVMLLTPVEDI